MDAFQRFAQGVNRRVGTMMAAGEVFEIIDPEDIFTFYLLAFPEGSNPMFRERTYHDCSCCKNFIRNMGGLVSFANGKKETVWDDAESYPEPYRSVAIRMGEMVRQYPIKGIYRTKERSYGAEHSTEERDGKRHVWNHLWSPVRSTLICSDPAAKKGEANTQKQMLETMVNSFTKEAFSTVIDLIQENGIYRGEEHLNSTKNAFDLFKAYHGAKDKEMWLWINSKNPISRYKNTVIGTLVQDLSDGVPIEQAVKMFESKVAPANYKRPKPVVTKKMIEDAFHTLEELGLETSLMRRFAVIEDINVKDVLFVDNAVASKMRGSLKEQLLDEASSGSRKPRLSPKMDIEQFISEIVPTASKMEVFMDGNHINKLVSLTAPSDENVKKLFKWDNSFGWSYNGEVTDSIKERVKRAGGNVNAKLRVSLSWHNFDDLDLHCVGPEGHIYYGHKQGILDVDMNAITGQTRDPVENLSWTNPRNGTYKISVNQFRRRETNNAGFTIQMEHLGKIQNYSLNLSPRDGESVNVITFAYRDGQITGVSVNPDMHYSEKSVTMWGVKTNTFVPVSTLMLSPNHWEDANKTGNRHWFFMLKGCVNPEAVRGIYNEFLRTDLDKHRKVFEVLGARTKCESVPSQLSGIGFTRGRDDSLKIGITRKDGSSSSYEVTF